MRLTLDQPKSVNEGEDVEKPIDERAPVQRLVIPTFRNMDTNQMTQLAQSGRQPVYEIL